MAGGRVMAMVPHRLGPMIEFQAFQRPPRWRGSIQRIAWRTPRVKRGDALVAA